MWNFTYLSVQLKSQYESLYDLKFHIDIYTLVGKNHTTHSTNVI